MVLNAAITLAELFLTAYLGPGAMQSAISVKSAPTETEFAMSSLHQVLIIRGKCTSRRLWMQRQYPNNHSLLIQQRSRGVSSLSGQRGADALRFRRLHIRLMHLYANRVLDVPHRCVVLGYNAVPVLSIGGAHVMVVR